MMGLSEVLALPLGLAGKTHWPLFMAFFSLSPLVTFLPEGVVLGF